MLDILERILFGGRALVLALLIALTGWSAWLASRFSRRWP